MATKQELEQELKQVKEERDDLLCLTHGRGALETKVENIAANIVGIDARLGELGQMSLREGEKAALRAWHAGIKETLTAEYEYIMKKLNGGK